MYFHTSASVLNTTSHQLLPSGPFSLNSPSVGGLLDGSGKRGDGAIGVQEMALGALDPCPPNKGRTDYPDITPLTLDRTMANNAQFLEPQKGLAPMTKEENATSQAVLLSPAYVY